MRTYTLAVLASLIVFAGVSVNSSFGAMGWGWAIIAGGSGNETGCKARVDASGNIIVAGTTTSTDLATTTGAYQKTYNHLEECFVMKYSASRTLLWCTYIGGFGSDKIADVQVASDGSIYLLINSDSTTLAGIGGALGNSDIIVLKMNASGQVVSGKRIGGGYIDTASAMHILPNDGSIYITGYTQSVNFPTSTGAFDSTRNSNGSSGFVMRLNSNYGVIFSTLFDGAYSTEPKAIAVATDQSVVITGTTLDPDLPTTTGAYDRTYNNIDAFVTKFTPNGSAVSFSTYLGGTGYDYGLDVKINTAGEICVLGTTDSQNFPVTSGCYDPNFNGGRDYFISFLNSTGKTLVRSTLAGGSLYEGSEYGMSNIELGNEGVYFAGFTTSTNFPKMTGAADPTANGQEDGVFGRFNTALDSLTYASYIGSAGVDTCQIAKTGPQLILCGTISTWPTFTYNYGSYHGGSDVYVAAVNAGLTTSYAISGYVKTSTGTAVSGVTVRANNGGGYGTTDGTGFYSLNVPYDWSGRVYGTKTNYTFVPSAKSYSAVKSAKPAQNFTAYVNPSISGYIRYSNGTVVTGATVTVNNGGGTVATNAQGLYTVRVPYNWTGKITPTYTGHTFVPTSKSYSSVTSSKTFQSFTAYVMPTISGSIKNISNIALAGVTLTGSNGGGSTTTNSLGSYFLKVPYGWTGTVTPSKTGYSFSPGSKSYSNVQNSLYDQLYVSTIMPKISGYVRDNASNPLLGVRMTGSNGIGTKTTNASGYYEFYVLYGWSGTITPTLAGYGFSPGSVSFTSVISDTTQNFSGKKISLSGLVKYSDNSGMSNVTLTLSTGGTTTTDAGGHFLFIVDYGWSGTITPSRSGYVFVPMSLTYSSLKMDQSFYFTGYCPRVAGYVKTALGAGVGGVVISGNNGAGSTTTSSAGYYSLIVPLNWSGAVTPSKTGYTFTPMSKSFTNVTNVNNTGNFIATLH